ncbi:acetyl-CoA carboxylase biotin carboxylase subunit [Candidatus Leptofilum sp.]|uniref:acetyl-CoA carboxylase biotin carboxylase subunit n=1 Tax=Candidatus Leptofilum sp. TaxID=3241576 RepID=UPI003B5BCA65
MFKRILIANRGEIAVRIIRTCREMGIETVTLYDASDMDSLHVRLADTCVRLPSPEAFLDMPTIVQIALAYQVDAVHPGYGFLAESASFARALTDAGITFIGPAAEVITAVQAKVDVLAAVREAGFPTVTNSPACLDVEDMDAIHATAAEIGYPLVIKSCRGGRGRGERLVHKPAHLATAVQRASAESRAVFGSDHIYLERAFLPAHQIGVQLLGDQHGNLIHLGEREGSIIVGNQKIIEESPSPNLDETQRRAISQTALAIGKMFNYHNVGTVEFLLDGRGKFYFSEIKARIQVEHSISEMLTGIDLVRQQILVAAGEKLAWRQEDVPFSGWSMMCRLNAQDPWQNFLPSPGRLTAVRLPTGPQVRVDSYVYAGCRVPPEFDSLVAKVTTWGLDRETCLARMKGALADFVLVGTPTNLPLMQRIMHTTAFARAHYDTNFFTKPVANGETTDVELRDLAVITAVHYARRHHMFNPTTPARWQSGWHQDSRRLPQ